MFSNQSMVEQKQEGYQIDDDFSNNSVAGWHSPLCAWCLCEQGLELGNGSHGICTRHADWLLQQYREHRAHCHHLH
jgi:hypothetical protein